MAPGALWTGGMGCNLDILVEHTDVSERIKGEIMAHTDPINPDILADVARQIGFFAGIRPDVFANQRLSLGASFAIWTLTPTITHDPAKNPICLATSASM